LTVLFASASKFAIEGYTDSLALELAGSDVHVSVVEPRWAMMSSHKSMVKALDFLPTIENDESSIEVEISW